MTRAARAEAGQAAFLFLGVLAALLAGTLVLFGFGQALGTRGKHQRAADLAAVSAAQVMRANYSRLFEPPLLRAGLPNPRHLSTPAYLALARAAAHRGARRNGAGSADVDTAELIPAGDLGPSGLTDGGGYDGPFAYRQGKPNRQLFSAL